jgi:RimJ/RimL family protein N-acetyltransferase
MDLKIEPIAENHFEGLHRALDSVSREGRYLAFLEAPSREDAFAFYRNIVSNDLCHFVAVLEGEVVGWCDILPVRGEARAHVGTLGIGLLARARRMGIGAKLMQATIAKAWAKGLTRIELNVRADNSNARGLYEKLGFELEGVRRKTFLVDGRYYDSFAMALLRERE